MANSEKKMSGKDLILWLAASAVLGASFWVSYLLNQSGGYKSLSVPVWFIMLFIVCFLSGLTEPGKRFRSFARSSYLEMHRVTWPTKEETVKVGLMVTLIVILVAIAIAIIDSGIQLVIKSILGV